VPKQFIVSEVDSELEEARGISVRAEEEKGEGRTRRRRGKSYRVGHLEG
jgi:hypothetical protein